MSTHNKKYDPLRIRGLTNTPLEYLTIGDEGTYYVKNSFNLEEYAFYSREQQECELLEFVAKGSDPDVTQLFFKEEGEFDKFALNAMEYSLRNKSAHQQSEIISQLLKRVKEFNSII